MLRKHDPIGDLLVSRDFDGFFPPKRQQTVNNVVTLQSSVLKVLLFVRWPWQLEAINTFL